MTWQNQQNECAPSKESDQPGHPPSLIRVFAVRMKKAWVFSYPISAQRSLWCPGWSESSLGAQSLCWFCHVAAQLVRVLVLSNVAVMGENLLSHLFYTLCEQQRCRSACAAAHLCKILDADVLILGLYIMLHVSLDIVVMLQEAKQPDSAGDRTNDHSHA